MKSIFTAVLFFISVMASFAQNSCAEAVESSVGVIFVDGIIGEEIPFPVCAPNGEGADGGMWYAFTPEADLQITVTTSLPENSGIDTRVHVYTGECGDLVCVEGDDDSGTGLLSEVSWNGTAEVTYYIAFDDRWSDSGFTAILSTSEIPVEPELSFNFNTVPLPNWSRTLGIVDMNGDYLDDALDVSSNNVFLSLQTESGDHETVTIPSDPATYPYVWSIAAGDLNADGYNDLLYGGGSGVTFQYRGEDGGDFNEWHTEDYVFSQRSNFIDLNNDGRLDAFVCHDVQPNVYYLNNGIDLDFYQGGMSDVPDGGNYGSVWIDYDNDGLSDLFIAKCRGGESLANYNQLFRNNGDGTFTEVSEDAGLYDNVQTWSSAWGDFNNDGHMDVLVGASSFSQGGHKLMMNNGDGTFSDETDGSGFDFLSATGIEWAAYDFDNDGLIDVVGGSGRFMMNKGDGTFELLTFNGVTNGPVGDMNNDGFLDIGNQGNIHFNTGNDNNWIKINTVGTESNINGIGARVEVYTPAGKQIRDVQSGVGFRFMHTLNVHFGLGEETEIDSLIINWPSGNTDVHTTLDINTFHILTEGEVEEEEIVNTADREKDGFLLFPNPTREELNFRFDTPPNGDASVSVFDMRGALVMQSRYTDKLNVSELDAGFYLVRITSEDRTAEKKFVKIP